MTDIQAILLDSIEIMQNNIAEDIKAEEPEPPQSGVDAPASEDVKPVRAKAKGRPKGALNKAPSKPRTKNAQVQEAPVEEIAYEPSSPRGT